VGATEADVFLVTCIFYTVLFKHRPCNFKAVFEIRFKVTEKRKINMNQLIVDASGNPGACTGPEEVTRGMES
jgi:hypothetical protein